MGFALPFNRDHPHIRSPEGVMSCDEIRFWIRELMDNHGWGGRLLARVLALPDRGALMSKLRRSWIYPGEQVRLSGQLDRIISGELVPVNGGQNRAGYARVADHPRPLELPARLAYDFKAGRLAWVRPRQVTPPTIPSFADGVGKFTMDLS